MANPTTTVTTPARTPRRGGILSVVPTIQVDRIGAASAVVWDAHLCSRMQDAPGLCWGFDTGATVKDDFDTPEWATTGEPFGGYFGVECFLNTTDYEALAREGLEQAEAFYIEREMQLQDFVSGTAINLGASTSIVEAIANAEVYADTHYRDLAPVVEVGYNGRPIIWLNRGDAVRAAAAFAIFPDREGNLVTANGTPVVASGEFLKGQVWVSGQAFLFESAITVSRAILPTTNREMAIAERVYALGFDCLAPAFTTVTP